MSVAQCSAKFGTGPVQGWQSTNPQTKCNGDIQGSHKELYMANAPIHIQHPLLGAFA